MLARRIIAISPDKAVGKQLTLALKAAGGAVETFTSRSELGTGTVDAALVVLHLDGALAGAGPELLARLGGAAQAIAILPRADLAAVVEIMRASDRVAGILVAEDLVPSELAALATRVLDGDVFGLVKVVPWGTQVHSVLVGSYEEKAQCIAQVSAFAEEMGVRRKYRESIDKCLDEMLMNALYDAPVDAQGKPLFPDVATRTQAVLAPEHRAIVQYACDGTQFALSVTDAFGRLERGTVLRYLHKCLYEEQQIDKKAGGAGLGLYLMASSASAMMFNVRPGIATEALCTFDLQASKLALETFGFFTERPAHQPSADAPLSVAPPAGPQTLLLSVLVGAIVATIALIALVLSKR
jgi:hypothetical protein